MTRNIGSSGTSLGSRRSAALALLFASIISFAAYGQQTQGHVEASASAQTGSTTTSVSLDGASGTVPTVPPIGDTKATLASNPNDLGTPMGALCWTRWETARHLLGEATSKELPAAVIDDLNTQIAKQEARSRIQVDLLPVDVQPFAHAVLSAIDDATREAAKGPIPNPKVTEIFNFEQFAGARAYADEAEKAPACSRP